MKTEIKYFDEMKESLFLSWFDTSPEGERVTIKAYEPAEVEDKNGKKEFKWSVYFQEKEKEKALLLNKTNLHVLNQLFGGEIANSIGKQIILFYRDDIEFKGNLFKGLRIKGCSFQQKPLTENETVNLTESKIA